MAFSGIIDRTSPITLARLLERIYDTEEPGELRLLHSETKETAVLVINRGEVVSSQCGELQGEAALKQLGSTFPWSYVFMGRNTAQPAAEEKLPIPRPTKRPALKLKPLLAAEEKPAFHANAPAMVPATEAPAPVPVPDAPVNADPLDRPLLRLVGEPLPGMGLLDDFVPHPDFPPFAPVVSKAKARMAMPTASLPAWLAGGDEHFIRFAESDGTWLGAIDSADWQYFRADYGWLLAMANGIGQSLGFSTALTAAVAEPQRAAAYGSLENGFVGILGGKGAGVRQVLQFDEPSD